MYSTRKSGARLLGLAFLAVVAGAGLAGCQRANTSTTAAMNETPIVEDEAMALRTWTASSAAYPNGDTVAGPTLFNYEPRRGMEECRYLYTDSGVFLGNFLLLPYAFVTSPPWSEVVYPGETFPPTHTAIPALPPAPYYNEPPLPAPAEAPAPAEEPAPAVAPVPGTQPA